MTRKDAATLIFLSACLDAVVAAAVSIAFGWPWFPPMLVGSGLTFALLYAIHWAYH